MQNSDAERTMGLLEIAFVVLLILLNGFFAFAEFALVSSRRGRQDDVPLKVFLENRFGQVYAKPQTGVPHQRLGGSVQ
jgi:CBS domain containing-hemolysin-like protein